MECYCEAICPGVKAEGAYFQRVEGERAWSLTIADRVDLTWSHVLAGMARPPSSVSITVGGGQSPPSPFSPSFARASR